MKKPPPPSRSARSGGRKALAGKPVPPPPTAESSALASATAPTPHLDRDAALIELGAAAYAMRLAIHQLAGTRANLDLAGEAVVPADLRGRILGHLGEELAGVERWFVGVMRVAGRPAVRIGGQLYVGIEVTTDTGLADGGDGTGPNRPPRRVAVVELADVVGFGRAG